MNWYEQKRQDRIDRLNDRADRKSTEASALFERSSKMASVIPFGQPIMVGHHSEQRDRNYRAKIGRTMDRACETYKEAGELEARAAAAESNTAISSDDPDAVVKLREKLAGMVAQRDQMKAVNAAHKRFQKKPETLEATDFSPGVKDKIRNYKPAYSWEPHPFPPYAFQNLGANIRRVEQRIQGLESQASEPVAEPVEGNGWRLVENQEINRLQIFFDGKPPVEVRNVLKGNGFRWAPSEMAWQRQLNNAARYHAEQVLKQIGGKS